jgi:predicted O-methyltransferase YrrM
MLMLRQASLDRLADLSGASPADIKALKHELGESPLPDQLLQRGAGLPFAQELPQGALLYMLVRSLRPSRVVETGVRPGYSTAWLLAGLEANRSGTLISLGPGTTAGRAQAVHNVTVGQFVPPYLRTRWTLALGNTEEQLQRILRDGESLDLFFYDNGPDAARARFELRTAWSALSPEGVVLAHHVDANPVWSEFCRGQGLPPQIFDWGPPPLGALGMRAPGRKR